MTKSLTRSANTFFFGLLLVVAKIFWWHVSWVAVVALIALHAVFLWGYSSVVIDNLQTALSKLASGRTELQRL